MALALNDIILAMRRYPKAVSLLGSACEAVRFIAEGCSMEQVGALLSSGIIDSIMMMLNWQAPSDNTWKFGNAALFGNAVSYIVLNKYALDALRHLALKPQSSTLPFPATLCLACAMIIVRRVDSRWWTVWGDGG